MNNVQHFNVKVFATPDSSVSWPDLIPVFHRWIQERTVPETLIDVADYAHVPAGPGVVLVAHEAIYSVDNRNNRLGLLYNRRTALDGSGEDRLKQALNAALSAARALEQEPELGGRLRFDPRNLEVAVNDRLLAPNSQKTFEQLSPVIASVVTEQLGGPVTLEWDSNPRGLFRVRVRRQA
jgi:hypothetical protein